MAVKYVCDNPACNETFHIEEKTCYCERCKPLANQWAGIEKEEMAVNAEQFAEDMLAKREQFFKGKTPVNTKPEAVVRRTKRRGSGKSART